MPLNQQLTHSNSPSVRHGSTHRSPMCGAVAPAEPPGSSLSSLLLSLALIQLRKSFLSTPRLLSRPSEIQERMRLTPDRLSFSRARAPAIFTDSTNPSSLCSRTYWNVPTMPFPRLSLHSVSVLVWPRVLHEPILLPLHTRAPAVTSPSVSLSGVKSQSKILVGIVQSH